ncbi:MAG: hypothetical protein KTR26_10185 [Flammeovirgaceae bacterium]|nr:hypothetical protein [Flammeovirgaceae bacterium]
MEKQDIFDFHFHLVFKNAIQKFENNYPTTLKTREITSFFDLKNPLFDLLDTQILHFLESQSCFEQVEEGGYKLGIAAICPIEVFFSSKKGVFGKLLNSRFVTRPFDQKFMDHIRVGKISYYQLFVKELSLYKKLKDAGKIGILTRHQSSSFKGLNVAIGIEGGHSLARNLIARPGEKDTFLGKDPKVDRIVEDFVHFPLLSADESLKHLQQAMWDDGFDLFYLTLTHLSQIFGQFLATHAFGLKFLNNPLCDPVGNGLQEMGKRVIRAAYNMKVKKKGGGIKDTPILIDIKHMSLKSRLDFYKLRKEEKLNQPIIATHMGVTGYSIKEWIANLKNAKRMLEDGRMVIEIEIDRKLAGKWHIFNSRFEFNAWSINLMDEDIIEILESDGLIGVSMDVRVLGWQGALGKGDKEEYISIEDYNCLFKGLQPQLESNLTETEGLGLGLIPEKTERQPLMFCFNLIHILSVGFMNTNKPVWEHVCLGSDYDGLIDPIKNAREAGSIQELYKAVLRKLPIAEESYIKANGGMMVLDRDASGNIDFKKLKENLDLFFYKNGHDFLKRRGFSV